GSTEVVIVPNFAGLVTLLPLLPLPSSPLAFPPQLHAEPSMVTAIDEASPPAIAVAWNTFNTVCTDVRHWHPVVSVAPTPNWPLLLPPHERTLPSATTTRA